MSELVISIQNDASSDIGEQIRAAFKALAEEADDQEVLDTQVRGLEWQHPDWEYGDPCPECGSEELHCEVKTYAIFEATGEGHLSFKEREEHPSSTETMSVTCYEPSCMVQLSRSPASYLVD